MKTYSLALRQKLVNAVDDGIDTYREIAEQFGVDEPYIYKLLRQRRTLGHIAPLPHGGGTPLKLHEKALNTLTELVEQEPDLTLDELRLQLRTKTKIEVSVSTIWYGLEKRGLSVKKRRG